MFISSHWLEESFMFQNSVRPSKQGNCLEFDPNNQDLIILRSSMPIFEVSVD